MFFKKAPSDNFSCCSTCDKYLFSKFRELFFKYFFSFFFCTLLNSFFFDVFDLFLYDIGEDSITNPFEESGNDTNKQDKGNDTNMQDNTSSDPLQIPSGQSQEHELEVFKKLLIGFFKKHGLDKH